MRVCIEAKRYCALGRVLFVLLVMRIRILFELVGLLRVDIICEVVFVRERRMKGIAVVGGRVSGVDR